eukprot:gene14947-biopygen6627
MRRHRHRSRGRGGGIGNAAQQAPLRRNNRKAPHATCIVNSLLWAGTEHTPSSVRHHTEAKGMVHCDDDEAAAIAQL